jgi:DivIVA domain-containing protein
VRSKDKEGTQMDDALGLEPAPSTASRMMTPLDIQQQEFRTATRGYKMRDVDEFLDQVTDAMTAVLAENERLRAGAPASGIGSVDPGDVAHQSDEIIARARDEAARIVAEAREQAAVMAGAGASTDADRSAVNAFLLRERDFLQSLAGLVQGHAESVKGMARAAREASAPAVPPEEAAEATQLVPEQRSGSQRKGAPEPVATSEPAPPEQAKSRDEETATLSDGEPVVLNEPEPASVGRGEAEPKAAGDDDSSLRELFWGED